MSDTLKFQRQTLRYLAYPPTSLPIRDLFLLDWVPVQGDATVLEVGVGCGETTARLAVMCETVFGIDVAGDVLRDLCYLEQRHANLSFQCIDVTSAQSLARRFDAIISFDTLEHVPDPVAYFDFFSRHLADGGAVTPWRFRKGAD